MQHNATQQTQQNSPQNNKTGNKNCANMLNKPVEVTSSSTENSTEKNCQKTLQVYIEGHKRKQTKVPAQAPLQPAKFPSQRGGGYLSHNNLITWVNNNSFNIWRENPAETESTFVIFAGTITSQRNFTLNILTRYLHITSSTIGTKTPKTFAIPSTAVYPMFTKLVYKMEGALPFVNL